MADEAGDRELRLVGEILLPVTHRFHQRILTEIGPQTGVHRASLELDAVVFCCTHALLTRSIMMQLVGLELGVTELGVL